MGHMDRTHQLHRETNQETSPQLQIMEEKLPEADKASIIPSLEVWAILTYFDLQPHLNDIRNGYLRKGRKTKPKRQNRTRNGKAWKRHSQVKAQVSKSQPKSTPTNPEVNK
ncbi:hypothetical protein Tco_1247232 [Tanacetum coccineum]